MKRVARIDGFEETAIGIAEIGHRIERDVWHRFAEHHVKHQKIVERRAWIADATREGVGRLDGEAAPEQPIVKRHVAGADRARRGMADFKAEAEILEEISRTGFGRG